MIAELIFYFRWRAHPVVFIVLVDGELWVYIELLLDYALLIVLLWDSIAIIYERKRLPLILIDKIHSGYLCLFRSIFVHIAWHSLSKTRVEVSVTIPAVHFAMQLWENGAWCLAEVFTRVTILCLPLLGDIGESIWHWGRLNVQINRVRSLLICNVWEEASRGILLHGGLELGWVVLLAGRHRLHFILFLIANLTFI